MGELFYYGIAWLVIMGILLLREKWKHGRILRDEKQYSVSVRLVLIFCSSEA